jgi:hypothetical protein
MEPRLAVNLAVSWRDLADAAKKLEISDRPAKIEQTQEPAEKVQSEPIQ